MLDASFEVDGITVGVTSGSGAVTLNLSGYEAETLPEETLLSVVRWFRQHHKELLVVLHWREGRWFRERDRNWQCRESDEELVTIITSAYSERYEKEEAAEVLRKRQIKAPAPVVRQPQAGHVYLIHSDSGHYKIGMSVRPSERINAISTGNPFKVTLLHSFPADDMAAAEKKLHTRYDYARVANEWFVLASAEVKSILKIRGFQKGHFLFR
jgi:sugar/nucleoside kinase (ribokinase family)